FERIYVSDLSRSVESGEILLQEQPYKGELIIDERTRELNFGKLTGKSYREFDTEQSYDRYDIESKLDFYTRIRSFYEDVKDNEDVIRIVGHDSVAKMIEASINGMPVESYNKIRSLKPYTIYPL